MRAVIVPAPTLPTVTLVATAVSQTEIDLVAIYPGIPFVVTYNFEYSDNGTTWIAITPQKASTYADKTLAAAQTRSYRVRVKLDGTRITAYSNVSTATTNPATSGVTPPSGTVVKWNPGHWTESDTVLGTTGTLAQIKSEIDAIAPFPNIVGHMVLVYWGFLQQQANTYTFTELDNIANYIKGKGKRWCLQVVAGVFNYGTNPPTSASNSPVPAYINNGNTTQWGQAGTRANGVTTILSGQSGWWGGDGNGHTYGAALWRPNVMGEWIKLHQALAAKYDSDPSFEMIHQGEDSFYQGTGSTNNSDYNDNTQRQNWKNFLKAQDAAWRTTNVSFSETFLQVQSSSIDLTNYITDTGKPWTNKPPMMGQTDALGLIQRQGNGLALHSWGEKTYAGQLGTLGDRRPLGRFMSEIQAPDLGFFQNLGAPREDVKAGLDFMGCTHAFWAIVPSPTALSTLPAKYPVTCTANVTGSSGTLTTPWPLPSGTYDMVTNAGGRMTATKGSKAVTFSASQTQTSPTFKVNFPLVPYNWSNGGTSSPAQNGTSLSYTDAGLLAWINDPANALANKAYPADYPTPGAIFFQEDYTGVPTGNVSLTSEWTSKGYTELENSGTPSNVQILTRAQMPPGLLANSAFPAGKTRVCLFNLAANEVISRLLWAALPAPQRMLSLSWHEYRDGSNLGGEKLCRFGNFVGGTIGANRGIDGIITLGQLTGTTLISNSDNMHRYADQSMAPGIASTGWPPGLVHVEVLISLSNGTNADGSVALYIGGTLIKQITGLQFFDTPAQAAIGLQLWDTGGWSSTGGGTESPPPVVYPIPRIFCALRIANSRQGVWPLTAI